MASQIIRDFDTIDIIRHAGLKTEKAAEILRSVLSESDRARLSDAFEAWENEVAAAIHTAEEVLGRPHDLLGDTFVGLRQAADDIAAFEPRRSVA